MDTHNCNKADNENVLELISVGEEVSSELEKSWLIHWAFKKPATMKGEIKVSPVLAGIPASPSKTDEGKIVPLRLAGASHFKEAKAIYVATNINYGAAMAKNRLDIDVIWQKISRSDGSPLETGITKKDLYNGRHKCT